MKIVKITLLIILALFLAVGAAAQDNPLEGITPEVTSEVTPEVDGEEFLSFFGISLETFGYLSAILFFLVEGIKRKFPAIFTGGENKWKTDVLLGVLATLLALKMFFPDPITIAACVIGLFVGGSGLHALKKTIIK